MKSYDKCLNTKRVIDPLLIESKDIFNHRSFKEKLCNLTQWTHSTNDLLEIYDDVEEKSDNNISSILRITSILEFSLGNVYQTVTQKTPPHLLKDLLQELKGIDVFRPIQVNLYFIEKCYKYF